MRNVQTVVNSGADIEQQNPYFKNATPVAIAVICKNPKVVDYLIGVSRDILLDVCNHLAIKSRKSKIGIYEVEFFEIRAGFSSFHELMQSRAVRRPSVCKLCANRYFYHRSGWIATKLTHGGPLMGLHPGCAQGQDQRSSDTDTFLITRKSLLLPQT